MPVFIDEDLDYIEANDFIAYEWMKRCRYGGDCDKCFAIGTCLKAWDGLAALTEDKRLLKSRIIKLVEKRFNNYAF